MMDDVLKRLQALEALVNQRLKQQDIPQGTIRPHHLDDTVLSDYVTDTQLTAYASDTVTFTNKTIDASSNTISNITAAMITNRSRTFFLDAQRFVSCEGSPALATGSIDTAPHWLLDAASTEGVIAAVAIPLDWASGTLTVKTYFAMVSATSGNIQLHVRCKSVANGGDTTAGGTSQEDTVSVPGTAGLLKIYTQSTTFAATAASNFFMIAVRRVGGSASDDAAADAKFFGTEITYTADM